MRSIYAAAFIGLLASCSAAVGEDPKRTNAEADHDEPVKHRTVAPTTILPLVRMSSSNPHNRSLTTIGGPATKSKNAAIIDGRGIKR